MTTPNHLTPDGSITNYGSWSTVQHRTQEEWEAGEYQKWANALAGIPKIGDKLAEIQVIGGALSDFWEIVTGIPDSDENDAGSMIRGFFDGISSALSGTSNPNPGDSFLTEVWTNITGQRNDLEDLQDKTQSLQDVVGYRATYMPAGSGTYPVGDWKWLGFTATVGPSVGTTVTPEGMIVLQSRGLWRADTQVYFSWEAVLDVVEVEIVVFDEFGNTFSKRSFKVKTGTGGNSQYTALCNYTFVTPRPGFGVQVRARTDALGREILTGLQYTSFTVNKWSNETE